MQAIILTLVLFSYWVAIGFAITSLFHDRLGFVQKILVAPAVGVSVLITAVFVISRVGHPIKDFGFELVIVLGIVSMAIITIKRPKFEIKKIAPYVGLVFIGAMLVAWPMFKYGLNWLSFANDDMLNYSLGAQRFFNNGYFSDIDLNAFMEGRDYSQAFWFMHAENKIRGGSELMLALVWAASSIDAVQNYMPVVVALHMASLFGIAAMTLNATGNEKSTYLCMGLLAISPMMTFGVLYQLIAQVGGLALLTAAMTLFFQKEITKINFSSILAYVPIGLLFMAISIWYPEVLPFLGISWVIYLILLFRKDRIIFRSVLNWGVALIVLLLMFFGSYLWGIFKFIVLQAKGGGMQSVDASNSVYSDFLVPKAISVVLGLLPMGGGLVDPWLSIAILFSLLLLLIIVKHIVQMEAKYPMPAVSMLVLMCIMWGILFFKRNDFGLFKLSMYMQPFLWSAIAVSIIESSISRRWYVYKYATVFVVVCLALGVQFKYVSDSTGEFSVANEVNHSSSRRVSDQLKEIQKKHWSLNHDELISDTSSPVMSKLQSFYAQGSSVRYFRDFLIYIDGSINPTVEDASIRASYETYEISTADGFNSFSLPKDFSQIKRRPFLLSNIKQDIFNGLERPDFFQGEYFSVINAPINHLVFVNSNFGPHYYQFDGRARTAFYPLEDNPLGVGVKFAALGKNFLFYVNNPTEGARLQLDITSTLTKQFNSSLPNALVQGVPLGFIGRGSARIYSEPIKFVEINNSNFISVDMNRDAKRHIYSPSGLMNMFGRDIALDSRLMTTYGKDISLISDEKFKALQPPTNLKSFPADLANKNLEYSGIYEDGWISEKSFFVLSPSGTSKFIAVTGSVPQIEDPKFSTVLKLSVNGIEIGSQNLGLGNFEFKVPVPSLASKQRIELVFSNYQTLPGSDGRVAPAKINFIGFE